ncbi:MAG TPA: GNAT family N-acetyltransferase [Ktedonobacteraceae bacterium]|nr:GNAT family N-acetyltransferase [Ktedonobacteraceae bacterium]
MFVAQVGETVAGLTEIYLLQDEAHPLIVTYRYGYLQSLVVSESFRKHGIWR